jgi:hypothetical protein
MLVQATFPTPLPLEARLALARAGGWEVMRGGASVATQAHPSILAARTAFTTATQLDGSHGRWSGPPGSQGGRTLGTPAAARRALGRPPIPRRTAVQVIRAGRAVR